MSLPDYKAEQRFFEPIVTQDMILSTLGDLTTSLSETMEQHGDGARCLEASFFRADGAVRRIAIETGRPMREPAAITRLFREKLDALTDPLDPGFGYDLIRLCTRRTEHVDEETAGLNAEANLEREKDFFLDRMAARFGSERVLTFQPNDTHIPETAYAALPAQYVKAGKIKWKKIRDGDEAPRRPLRLFTSPEPIDVIAEVPEGPPLQFRWRHALHAVAFVEGPERIAMEWWRHQDHKPTRDYFRVESREGRRFWLYRRGIYGRETSAMHWFVHGIFA
jgi:protein ImuB